MFARYRLSVTSDGRGIVRVASPPPSPRPVTTRNGLTPESLGKKLPLWHLCTLRRSSEVAHTWLPATHADRAGGAGFLGLPVLSPEQLLATSGSAKQAQALRDGGFADRTPLWFYLLAEAKHHGGARLGPVGSTIV